LDWSHGEVTKPETINYRTQRSEKNGLFDERIFGPEKDFECYCGKYKGVRYKGIECEKCGVEVTRAIVRRERMGHIELAVPVSHIWFLRNVPSRMALLLGVTASHLEKVMYFAGYIVTKVDTEARDQILKDLDSEYKSKMKSLKDDKSKDALKVIYTTTKKEIKSIEEGAIVDDATYSNYALRYGSMFEAEVGAEAIYTLFKKIDLSALEKEVVELLENAPASETKKVRKRLSLIRAMQTSKIRPEWMFLTHIPIIPAALRPMVGLDGGRFATSDVNDLYRRVINRNNRLKKLIEIKAPNVILRNEKRILQEAVDALVDNSMRSSGGTSFGSGQRRPLKSLADNLKGKQGLFRANLLGKRVDYSARSVIVVGPDLKLTQCGLPKYMALELFRPFIISKLIEREIAFNIRGAGRLIDEAEPEVWGILEEVIKDKYVLLNRAPTLHRLGIQAFQPILIEGSAIQVHPLVVQAFNADFDGDQMAVHLPLSREAQAEASHIMASYKNLLRPGSGTPIISVAHQDIILGCYWMTRIVEKALGEGKYFSNPNDAIAAFDFDIIDLRAKIAVLPTDTEKYSIFEMGVTFETTVGRLLFNSTLPKDYLFINTEITKNEMSAIVNDIIEKYTHEEIAQTLDKIKSFGFKYSTHSGTTFSLDDVAVPENKAAIIEVARKKVDEIEKQFEEGLYTEEERFRKNIEIWHGVRLQMEEGVAAALDVNGPVYSMWKSGARGNLGQITNMAGLKGLISDSKGRTVELPILSSSKEGLTPLEYFTGTHGSRKGLGDTALNTAQSGYLTRKLFDVSQDVVVNEDDCETKEGILMRAENLAGIQVPISENIIGRFLADTVHDAQGTVLFKRNEYVTKEIAQQIEAEGIEELLVRSPMTCATLRGVCVKCYGTDLGTGKVVALGEAVGTVAAQSIGEPATQLTMRTFHAGGTAAVGGDIVAGLPRVSEIFERRPPKNAAVISETGGTVLEIIDDGREKKITVLPDIESKKKGKDTIEYIVHFHRMPLVKKGDEIKKGDFLTDGSADLVKLFKFAGKEQTQEYVISEIGRVYELQGAGVSRKHIEVIIKQMFSRVRVEESGSTDLTPGTIIEHAEFVEANRMADANGGDRAVGKGLILGITNVSLSRKSFLSAASFQNTSRVLIQNAVRGAEDQLIGLKENVIIGRLIPAGTGFEGSPKYEIIKKVQEEMREEYAENEE
jgi:DNA-directed RNA polymerase subunit beta'